MLTPSIIIDQSFTMIRTIAMFLLSVVSLLQLHESCAKQEREMTSMSIVDGYGPPGPDPYEDYNNNRQETSQPLKILFWYHQLLGQIIYPEFVSDDQTNSEYESFDNNLLRKDVHITF